MTGNADQPLVEDPPQAVRHLHARQESFGSDVWLLSERTASTPFGVWRKALFGQRGKLLLGELRYDLGRDGLAGDHTMRRRGKAGLRASEPSLFSDRMVLRGARRRVELRPRPFRSGVEVFERNHRIGQCAPTNWNRTSLRLTLERELPLELAVFALWLTWLLHEGGASA